MSNNNTQPENFTEEAVSTAQMTPSKRNANKHALNTTKWQYITPEYRKGGPQGRFELLVNGEWVMADAFGYPTNDPDESSIRKVMSTPPPAFGSATASFTPVMTRTSKGITLSPGMQAMSLAPMSSAPFSSSSLFAPSLRKRMVKSRRLPPRYRRHPPSRRNLSHPWRRRAAKTKRHSRHRPSHSATRSKNNK